MLAVALALGLVVCAVQCIRALDLLVSVLWLAATSALLSILIFILGAADVAVIELSVGAGLVTVLFVFAVGIAGKLTRDLPALVPKPLAWAVTLLAVGLLLWTVWPAPAPQPAAAEPSFAQVLWGERTLDVWVQVTYLFLGVLGILSLLAPDNPPIPRPSVQAERVKAPAALPKPDGAPPPVPVTGTAGAAETAAVREVQP